MTNTITQSGDSMRKNKLFLTIIILSIILSGCVGPTEPVGTPVPTPTATVEPTIVPTFVPTPTPTPVVQLFPLTYKVWVDSYLGVNKIRAANGSTYINLPSDFNKSDFKINIGDTVVWINDNDPSSDFPLTIISNDGLWDNKTGYLRYSYSEFEYTFNKTGTYMVSIKELPRKVQKITVNS